MPKFLLIFFILVHMASATEVIAKYKGLELKYSEIKALFEQTLSQLDLEEAIEQKQSLLKQFTESYLYHLALLELAQKDGFSLKEKLEDKKQQFLAEQSLLSRWTEEKLLKSISVSYTEALLYYEEHKDEFQDNFEVVYPKLKDFLKRQKLRKIIKTKVMKVWQDWSMENLVK